VFVDGAEHASNAKPENTPAAVRLCAAEPDGTATRQRTAARTPRRLTAEHDAGEMFEVL
jgi:hypothetical protein